MKFFAALDKMENAWIGAINHANRTANHYSRLVNTLSCVILILTTWN